MAMANNVNFLDILPYLRRDFLLYRHWLWLADALGVTFETTEPLRARFATGGIGSHELFREVLAHWVRRGGGSATLSFLLQTLRTEHFNYIAEQLEAHFGAACTTARVVLGEAGTAELTDNQDTPREMSDENVPGAVSILRLVQGRAPHTRPLIFVDFLLRVLNSVHPNMPVAVISINGQQRTGKSFMLSNFVKYLKYGQGQPDDDWLDSSLDDALFEWKASFQRVTSGIQVWSEPLLVDTPQGDLAVILMDTQGLFDSSTSSQENAVIFAFSILLSSIFIYNDKNTAENSLHHLRTFLELARFTADQGMGSRSSANVPQLTFQKLVLLLRDWQAQGDFKFGYYDDNGEVPEGQLKNLKTALLGHTSEAMHAQARATREAINGFFDYVGVAALPVPGTVIPDRQNGSSATWDPTFHNHVVQFVRKICSPSFLANSKKTIFGDVVTASGLKEYVIRWGELIMTSAENVAAMPIFDSTMDAYYRAKVEPARRDFVSSLTTFIQNNPEGVSRAAFQVQAGSEKERVLASIFRTTGAVLGGEEVQQRYRAELESSIDTEIQQMDVHNGGNVRRALISVENSLTEADNYLTDARGRRDGILARQNTYQRATKVQRKKRNRILGIVVSRTVWDETVYVYDDDAFQSALEPALRDVEGAEGRQRECLARAALARDKANGY